MGRDPWKPLVEINRLWYAVRHRAGLHDVRLHGLRHSYASILASGGASLLVIGRILGHKDSATTARYAHLLADPVRDAADAASGHLATLLTNGASAPPERGLKVARG